MYLKSFYLGMSILFILPMMACDVATILAPVAAPLPTDPPVLPSATPAPTATIAPTPTVAPTATVVPTATPDKRATQAAIDTAAQEALIARIKTELEQVGLPSQGSLGWIGTSADTIKVTAYHDSQYLLVAGGKEFANFVMKMDIKWTSQSGLAGCGVIFRASPTTFESANYYMFITLRLSGAPVWDFEYFDHGKYTTDLMGNVQFNHLINIRNGSTNTYYLVVDGDKLSVYTTNGKRLGTTSYNKLDKGSIVWTASQESGETTCTFNNAWIWVLPQNMILPQGNQG